MKNKPNISFDELVKQSFEGVSTNPPAGVWEGIASQIGAVPATVAVKSVFIKSILGKVIIATTVVVSSVGVYQLAKTDEPKVAAQTSVVQTEVNNGEVLNNQQPVVSEEDNQLLNVDTKDNAPNKPVNQHQTNDNQAQKADMSSGVSLNRNKVMDDLKATNQIVNRSSTSNELDIVLMDSVFCMHEPIQLYATYQQVWDKVYKLNPGAHVINGQGNNWTIAYETPGKYQVVLKGLRNNEFWTVTKNIYVEKPSADFAAIQTKNGLELTANYPKAKTYIWSINGREYKQTMNAKVLIPYADFGAETRPEIRLEVKRGNCSEEQKKTIALPAKKQEIFIPNVFTPTVQDGKNDCYQIKIEETIFYYLVIKNRNGRVVFESSDSNACWDGKDKNTQQDCLPDSYFYQLIYQLPSEERKVSSGKIQLF